MVELQTQTKTTLYECMECGQKNTVTVQDRYGFCKTQGCLNRDLIQYVFYPSWIKPKICRAGRNVMMLR
ncbi:hypothetical protein [Risungbinella massiliensis]|uniref:hypothetical protein n=1 Tax=Risungbinella massiliensis TaxID=1329796 RepID=UPI0005CBFFED|nr:hypothetical protein [Risungbinella massiliensis]